ncbi:KRAB-A domain-containing protein 2-like [Vanessa atalanta]|uniref:KRAB-A domain-containing protein 2-like n=1 Tax=Vanessa atalanta TaxID=42275 RepID=UPI001FCCFD6E|nr:KRAB-A domain-containing protein 2-like [Vanessa atalanta]
MSANDVNREIFYQRVHELLLNKPAPNTFLMTAAKYTRLIQQVKEAKTKVKKHPADYRRLKRYNLITTSQGDRLVMAHSDAKKSPQMFVKLEEIYDIIREYHLKMNHAGRTRLMYAIKPKYKNITTAIVMLYLSLCEGCKNKVIKRSKTVKSLDYEEKIDASDGNSEVELKIEVGPDPLEPVVTDDASDTDVKESVEEDSKVYPEIYSRGQMDILDVTTVAGETYKCLMVYRNLVTKFIHLKPLKTISIDESVDALLEIFLVFGAPNILQSKNGIYVTKQICRRMYTAFPDIKIVCAEASRNKNDFVGQSNEDILRMLRDWYKQNSSLKWYQGVKYVQYLLNNTFNVHIRRTPSESVFGYNPKRGLATFMTKNEYDHLVTESDLQTALEEKESGKNSEQLLLEESIIPSCSFIKLEPETNDVEDVDDEDNEHARIKI